VVGIDLEHCKGCGICAEVCPPKIKAIEMVQEAELRQKEHE
jgi:pyruvate ferredoxin oxidoreductase delta subunit